MTSPTFVIHHKISKVQSSTCILYTLRSGIEKAAMKKEALVVGGLIYCKLCEQLQEDFNKTRTSINILQTSV